MRFPLRLPLALAGLFAALLLLVATGPARGAAAGPAPSAPRTVILVRHAEKASDDARDPSLSEAGLARAEALARLLGHAPVTRLLASEFRRTRDTLAPLARLRGLAVEVIPAGAPERWAHELGEAPAGATLVVAGHSNTLPALAQSLGVTLPDLEPDAQGARLRDDEYDRLFVLTLPAPGAETAATVLELRYGS